MPKLSAVLNDGAFQALDESLKTFYVQNTETKDWWLDVDEPGKLDTAGQNSFKNLKSKLDGAFRERDESKAALKAFTDLGKTADEIKEALAANRPEEVTKLVEKYEAEKEALKKSFEEPLKAASEKAAKYEQQIQRSLQQSAIAEARTKYDLNETADFVLRDYIRAIPKEEGSDEYITAVFDNGERAMVAGQPMTVDQLIKGFQEGKRFPAMFNVGAGAGTGNAGGQAPHMGGKTFIVDREASKSNPELYRQAKEAAAKAGGSIAFTPE